MEVDANIYLKNSLLYLNERRKGELKITCRPPYVNHKQGLWKRG